MWKPSLWPLVPALVGALGGCFYVDGINQRPAAQIRLQDPEEAIFRNDDVRMFAVAADPDGEALRFVWRAYACGAEPSPRNPVSGDMPGPGCDPTPYASTTLETFDFVAPSTWAGDENGTSARSVFVVLEVFDTHDAPASPLAWLTLPVLDRDPQITLRKASRYAVNSIPVEGTPVELFALISDGDNTPDDLEITWEIFGPGTWELVDATPASTPVDELTVQYNKILTPSAVGLYTVRVTVDDTPEDSSDAPVVEKLEFSVGADSAPCIAQTLPVVSPIGQALPITQLTQFRVPVVRDDLDGFPVIPNDPIAGAPTFTWSLKPPGATSYAVQSTATTSAFALDPASYAIGDIVDVRVEIADRQATPINCPVDDLFCSTVSQPTCVQRTTWRVEVR